MITIRPATLEDWPAIKELHGIYSNSRAAQFIHSDLKSLEGYFLNSLSNPKLFGLILAFQNGVLCGMVAIQTVVNYIPTEVGAPPVAHAFIHTAYVAPKIGGIHISPKVGLELDSVVCDWAKERNCGWIFGNVRVHKRNIGFMRKYGYEPIHLVIGKDLKNG